MQYMHLWIHNFLTSVVPFDVSYISVELVHRINICMKMVLCVFHFSFFHAFDALFLSFSLALRLVFELLFELAEASSYWFFGLVRANKACGNRNGNIYLHISLAILSAFNRFFGAIVFLWARPHPSPAFYAWLHLCKANIVVAYVC